MDNSDNTQPVQDSEKVDLSSSPAEEIIPNFFNRSDEANFPVFWSPSLCCFYVESERNSVVPEDALEIPRERHTELIGNQDGLRRIIAGKDGYPISTKKHSPTPVLIEQQKMIVENYRKTVMRRQVTTNGITIRLESSDQTNLTNMLTGAQFTGQESFDFKQGTSWVTLDKATLSKIVTAIHKYTQGMYTAARMHCEMLDTYKDLPQEEADPVVDYNYEEGWPTFEEFMV